MSNIEELKENLQQVNKMVRMLEDKIDLLEKEKEDIKKKEVITYAIGDIVKDTHDTVCMLVQSHAKTVVLINLANGNRYYGTSYKTNVGNVDKISEKEFNSICNNKGGCWSKVELSLALLRKR